MANEIPTSEPTIARFTGSQLKYNFPWNKSEKSGVTLILYLFAIIYLKKTFAFKLDTAVFQFSMK